ncbi:ionotropic receptor 75a-like [Lutzomyia longipalpis]|uniref:ionotropic receptor 75a-like n=1 Tax=Lutzomyia longipalpis TaxID=7200 RepID=UPI00248401A8|nr:ionotropic receptor 75a-like [Lutzomyia longipalpis]
MEVIYEDYGDWSYSEGIKDTRSTRILSRRRMNLHGKSLIASMVVTNKNSLAHLTDYQEREIDSITKVNYVLTHHLMDVMNASKEFIFTNSWGIKNRTSGKWDGMVGDLVDERADLGGTSLFMTVDRVTLIDYVSMTVPTYGAFLFRSPPLSYVSNIFYLPFRDTVWVAGFALVALSTIIFFITWRINICYNKETPASEIPRFSDIIMNATGAITQQGAHMEAKVASGRIASFFLFLSMFFLYTSYTANIVALLQSTTTSISSLETLKDSTFEFGVEDIVYNRYYFKIMNEPLRKEIYETKIIPPGKKDKFMNKTEGIAKMRKGLFTFFTEARAGYKMIEETFFEHEKCGLMEIEYLQVTYPWYSIKKYSPYREIIKTQ